ncbi:hypothetical protein Csa_005027 [Cucumis sativus]|uniref:Uncharacterized protein n=1 Tax=Cucumis sativus TaxID=3659 RepID=A0A0A0KB76_CUCSA|nr:hypothetical protein Csa_005027 [Cucumis sativus]
MFSIKIDKLDPLLDAISLFTDIVNDKICLKFSLSTFSIIARYQHPFFFAMLFIPEPLFAEYFVGRDHILRVSLLSLHTALARGQTYSSLRIHLQEEQNIICLAFEPSRHSPVPMRRKMRFEVPMEDWSAGEIDFDAKSFSIESDLFRDIITTFYDYNEVDTSN